MKTTTTFSFALMLVFCIYSIKCSSQALKQPVNHHNQFLWGEINVAYSTRGPGGNGSVNYRSGKLVVTAQYQKLHTCYDSDELQKYFASSDHTQYHITNETVSVQTGIVLPGKLGPSLSIGVSYAHFKYINTSHIENNVTIERIWETALDKDYTHESLGERSIYTFGIPVKIKLHFSPKRFVGFNLGLNADINAHCSTFGAELGIRLGRIDSKKQ